LDRSADVSAHWALRWSRCLALLRLKPYRPSPIGNAQARGFLRAIVSRAAFKQILGAGFDLPLTLRACPDESSTAIAYDTLRSLLRAQGISYADIPKTRQLLCYPYREQVQVINSDDTRLLFSLPAEHCPAIKDLVKRILDDPSGREYGNILNGPLQMKVGQLFTGSREGFPTTSGFRSQQYVSFAVRECTSNENQSILNVTMKRRS